MRGFLGGIAFGALAVGAGLVGLSVMAPVAPVPDVRSDAPEAASGATGAGGAEVGLSGRDPQVVEVAPSAPSEVPVPGTASGGDTETAGKPKAPEAPDRPSAPAAAEGAGVAVSADSAVAVAPGAAAPVQPTGPVAAVTPGDTVRPAAASEALTAPVAPEGGDAPTVTARVEDAPAAGTAGGVSRPEAEAAPEVSTAPAERPDVSQDANRQAAETAEAAVTPGLPAPDSPVVVETAPKVDAPASEPVPQVATAPAAPAPEPVKPAPAVADAPDAMAAPTVEGAAIATPETDAPPDVSETAPGEGPRVVVLTPEPAETLRPRIGKPVASLIQREAVPETTPAVAETNPDAPPLERFAAPFDNPEGKPLMSIVLIDDDKSIGVEALAEFPYPLTFAVDPSAPDAEARMARHRAAGFEVVALVDLPAAGSAQDAEVALSVIFERVPQALAVLEGTGTGVQGNRAMSDQVSAFAGASGRGVITQGNGLNTMQKLAVKEGIPAVSVFRDFDGAGQTPAVMRRFLDQAAFRAGQEGAVVMLGRVRPDTVSALLIWALQDRATRVALAPVSAVLKASVSR
ncbi:MAG: divergent polysaccharide deacetylase family protein [Pseudooceanicola sp.]|nr:divergent polysaccharide deacetylase family protein [Pseudooceanicola sp.]